MIEFPALPGWTSRLPARPGWFELRDERRRVHRFVRVFRTAGGELAVANPCACKHAFHLRMWLLPCFRGTRWRGPVEVPGHLPPACRIAALPDAPPGGSARCLLGDHDPLDL